MVNSLVDKRKKEWEERRKSASCFNCGNPRHVSRDFLTKGGNGRGGGQGGELVIAEEVVLALGEAGSDVIILPSARGWDIALLEIRRDHKSFRPA
jgi:hypothetical protein